MPVFGFTIRRGFLACQGAAAIAAALLCLAVSRLANGGSPKGAS